MNMIQSKMIEKEEDFVCSMNHKLPIYMVVCDKSISKNKRLLCNECMDNLESNLNDVRSFKKVAQLIEENQMKKVKSVERVMNTNINQINELQETLHQLKSFITQQLDQLIDNADEWIKCLQCIGQQNDNYSFFEQLDNLINQVKIGDQQEPLISSINTINQSWNQKIIKKLNQFKAFELTKKCEQLLSNLENINQQPDLFKSINITQEQQHIDNIISKQSDVEFKLIDDFNKQTNFCYTIVFDNTKSIMVSSDKNDIIVWNFTKGKLKLSNRFKVHSNQVQCIVYSKKMNCFISGSWDKSIICWKQINNNEWKWSQPYQQHTDWVSCLILNKHEDQLISGGRDDQIKIWDVDFIKNELTYLYSLDNTNAVYSLSFNQSETMFASCAKTKYLIWKIGVEDIWYLNCIIDEKNEILLNELINQQLKIIVNINLIKYKQQVTNGYQIYFMNDQQFLWVTCNKEIDSILIFELQDGVFKQNQDKNIQLNTNQLADDDWNNFPIIYNKDKNMLLVRHKHHIYILSNVNEVYFKIIGSFNCEIEEIFGTMTNDAQYLVFWDGKSEKYQSYELLHK